MSKKPPEKSGFCCNSKRWLSFVYLDLNYCPNNMNCGEHCTYYQELKTTTYYRKKWKDFHKMGVLRKIKKSPAEEKE